MAVHSFDVFDTVLTRRTGRPQVVHRLTAERFAAAGHVPVPVPALALTRARAERRLAAASGRPARLPEIADEVTAALALPSRCAPVLTELEMQVERELVVAVPGAADLLDRARGTGDGRVVFVSDTPHAESFLCALLDRAGLLRPGDRVFGSADRGASKSAGGLLTLVARELGVRPGDITHTGDNRRSDVTGARAEGCSAQHRPQAALHRYEQVLEESAEETAGVTSWLAGASRLARLELAQRGAPGPVAAVSAGVAAPVLLSYAVWLAGQARARGLRRLYFVARDGEALLAVARPVLAALTPQVECRYLYGSRRAWMLPAGASSPEVLAEWTGVKHDATTRTALARVGLTPEQLPAGVDLPSARHPDRVLTGPQARLLSQRLSEPPLHELVLRRAGEEAEAALGYLRQEGFGDDVPSALVDLGWRGHTARAFDVLVAALGGRPVEHLFLGLFGGAGAVRSGPRAPDMAAWLFDSDRGRRPTDTAIGRLNVVLEMFCAGTEGRLCGYRRDPDGTVRPELVSPTNASALDWGLGHVREALCRVAESVAPQLGESALHVDLRRVSWTLLRTFWLDPTAAEARAWGTFPWEEETVPPRYPIAEPLQTGHVLGLLPGRSAPVRHYNSWRAGSALVSPQPWRSVLLARRWGERQVPRVRRLERRVRLSARRRNVRLWSGHASAMPSS